ncbi:MAG: hypothetical protein ACR2KX_12280, partial [Chitinophagaceae bacterium]
DYTNTIPNVSGVTPKKIIGIPDGFFIGGNYDSNGNNNYLQKCVSEGTSFVPTWVKLYSQEFGSCARGNIINMKPTKDGNFIYLGLSYANCLNYGNGPTMLFKVDKDGKVL